MALPGPTYGGRKLSVDAADTSLATWVSSAGPARISSPDGENSKASSVSGWVAESWARSCRDSCVSKKKKKVQDDIDRKRNNQTLQTKINKF